MKAKHLQFCLALLDLFMHYCHVLLVFQSWGRACCAEKNCAIGRMFFHDDELYFCCWWENNSGNHIITTFQQMLSWRHWRLVYSVWSAVLKSKALPQLLQPAVKEGGPWGPLAGSSLHATLADSRSLWALVISLFTMAGCCQWSSAGHTCLNLTGENFCPCSCFLPKSFAEPYMWLGFFFFYLMFSVRCIYRVMSET